METAFVTSLRSTSYRGLSKRLRVLNRWQPPDWELLTEQIETEMWNRRRRPSFRLGLVAASLQTTPSWLMHRLMCRLGVFEAGPVPLTTWYLHSDDDCVAGDRQSIFWLMLVAACAIAYAIA